MIPQLLRATEQWWCQNDPQVSMTGVSSAASNSDSVQLHPTINRPQQDSLMVLTGTISAAEFHQADGRPLKMARLFCKWDLLQEPSCVQCPPENRGAV